MRRRTMDWSKIGLALALLVAGCVAVMVPLVGQLVACGLLCGAAGRILAEVLP